MDCVEVADRFFTALAEERWPDAVGFLAESFKREHAPHVRYRFEKMYFLEGVEPRQLPEDLDGLFELWLATTDFRAAAARALAEAQLNDPDLEWEVVGGVAPPKRRVVGQVLESPDRAIVVYRRGDPERGAPTTLQFVREGEQWRICSEEFAFEGHPGLAWKRKD